jgi:hypothetical protein
MGGNPWASVGHSARLWPKFFAGPLLAYADPRSSRRAENANSTPRRAEPRVAEIEPTSNAASEEESCLT